MKRFFLAAVAVLALLVPTLASAQATMVYIPGAHPRVVVVQPVATAPASTVEKASPTPAEIIALHAPIASVQRANPRVNYPAVAHCDRLIADARRALKENF